MVNDAEGFPAFSLVNKVTGDAIKHSIGASHPVVTTLDSFSMLVKVIRSQHAFPLRLSLYLPTNACIDVGIRNSDPSACD